MLWREGGVLAYVAVFSSVYNALTDAGYIIIQNLSQRSSGMCNRRPEPHIIRINYLYVVGLDVWAFLLFGLAMLAITVRLVDFIGAGIFIARYFNS